MMRSSSTWFRSAVLVTTVAAMGCFADRERSSGPIVASRLDLSPIAGTADPAVGVAVDEAGTRYVLTEGGALHRVDPAGFVRLWQAPTDVEVPWTFTDLVWIGDGTFLVATTTGDLRLAIDRGTMEPSFGYDDGRSADAIAVTGDVVHALAGDVFESYDLATGSPLAVAEAAYPLRGAGGMAYWEPPGGGPDARRIVLGVGDELYLVDRFQGDEWAYFERLGRLGLDRPVEIQGMAVDADRDEVSFLDAASNELRTLPLTETVETARQRQRELEPIGS